MSARARLAALGAIGQLMLDARLAELRAAAAARAQSLDRLEALVARPAPDLEPIAAAQAELRYQRWAEARRAEINLQLARQTAAWMAAEEAARQAFGKTEALRLLREKLR